MTSEQRLSSMEAGLERLVRREEQSHARRAWLALHRAGFRHMDDDLLDPNDQTDSLVAALMSSQLRTEESVRRAEESRRLTDESLRALLESVNRLTETFQSYLDSRRPKDDHPLQT